MLQSPPFVEALLNPEQRLALEKHMMAAPLAAKATVEAVDSFDVPNLDPALHPMLLPQIIYT